MTPNPDDPASHPAHTRLPLKCLRQHFRQHPTSSNSVPISSVSPMSSSVVHSTPPFSKTTTTIPAPAPRFDDDTRKMCCLVRTPTTTTTAPPPTSPTPHCAHAHARASMRACVYADGEPSLARTHPQCVHTFVPTHHHFQVRTNADAQADGHSACPVVRHPTH